MIFSFDDGCISQYENAKPLFNKYGIVGTLFLCGSFVNRPGHIKTWHVEIFISKGWEIGSHTFSHLLLTDLPDSEIRKEIEENLEYFSKFNISMPGFSYPWSVYDERVLEIVKEYHVYARSTSEGNDNRHSLKSITLGGRKKNEDIINSGIDFLTLHRVGEKSTSTWGTNDLEDLILYYKENGISIERGQDRYVD